MSDLTDPSNPRSPYNRYNMDSPFSVTNPNSSFYDPSNPVNTAGCFVILGGLAFCMIAVHLIVRAVVWAAGYIFSSAF
jgi:hypothetical protein